MRFLVLLFAVIAVIGCSTTYLNRNPVGEKFPKVSGQTLDEKAVSMPGFFAQSKVVLLLGYKQNSQFDIDRWLIGLDMTQTEVKAFEIPAIQGLFPKMFKTTIDNGMRSGIPKELWGGVITVYDDGDLLQEFTGNENPNNARVMVLDEKGKIIYFHDKGFSVPALNLLRQKVTSSEAIAD